jgi:hypothetical protein
LCSFVFATHYITLYQYASVANHLKSLLVALSSGMLTLLEQTSSSWLGGEFNYLVLQFILLHFEIVSALYNIILNHVGLAWVMSKRVAEFFA